MLHIWKTKQNSKVAIRCLITFLYIFIVPHTIACFIETESNKLRSYTFGERRGGENYTFG